MKIALIGYGKMGQMIEKCALEKGHEITAKVSSHDWPLECIHEADVCIEFTEPDSSLDNIERLVQMNKNIVVGTTGWYEFLPSVQKMAEEYQIGILYSPNFSIGIYLMQEILKQTAQLMEYFPDYDVAEMELHHRQKKDSPSGTAQALATTIKKNMDRVENVPISSVRCGSIPGTHTVLFDSIPDTITITHTARNREGFAFGALQAAEWIKDKKGLYTFEDCLKALTCRKNT